RLHNVIGQTTQKRRSNSMDEPDSIFIYKMVTDNGGAPCVHRGVLSLAICKPKIRKTAGTHDVIIGFGGRRLGNRLIYVARVTEKLCDGQYYRKSKYRKRPDCIYRDDQGHPKLVRGARFHAD